MELNKGMLTILSNLYIENPGAVIYICFLLLLLLTKVTLVIITYLKINNKINKIVKKQHIKNYKKDSFVLKLEQEYTDLLINNEHPKPKTFINEFILRQNTFILWFSRMINQGDFIFILLGILGAFIIILSAVLHVNLDGVQNIQELYNRLTVIISVLKPSLYIFLFSIICAILNNIVLKILNPYEKINVLKIALANYLKQIENKINNKNDSIEAINSLIQTIENNLLKFEDIIQDSFNDGFLYLKEVLLDKKEKNDSSIEIINKDNPTNKLSSKKDGDSINKKNN